MTAGEALQVEPTTLLEALELVSHQATHQQAIVSFSIIN
jgi:hypothetical protein